jgi:hypothetical protein
MSIWQKVRKIIIGLKYSQENCRLLKQQIAAQNIENYNIPQLSEITFILRLYYFFKK